ncbi:MAG: spermidine synthase [Verrucomicrobiota bacterium]|jgi:spermidine synthase
MVRHLLRVFTFTGILTGIYAGEIAPLSVETPYNHITIEHFGSVVEMRSVWRTKIYRESAVDLSDPSHLLVPYTMFVAASAAFHPAPQNVLMIGLGGGAFNQFFDKAFPSAALETIELDPQVLALAQQHLAFKPSARDKVTIMDGRMFLRRSKGVYDWIILDAFRGGFVPPHLKTAEFYRLAQGHLASNGVFMANVRTDSALFASDLRTMQSVFPQVGYFDVQKTENAVIVGLNFSSPVFDTMLKDLARLSFNDSYKRSVDLAAAAKLFRLPLKEANKRAPLITDDFAPTEFLDAMKNNNSRN